VLQQSSRWYAAGLAFTVLHFAFVPFIAFPIRDIIEDRSRGESTRDMRRWLDIHRIRVFVADIPSWASFLAAVLTTFHL